GSGQACITSASLTPGTITATYNGDTCRAGSAGTVAVSVVPATSTTVLAVSPNPSVCGQPLTLTATVTVVPPGTGVPSGSVTFFDGNTPLGTAMVVGNTATLLLPGGLGAGTHSLVAVYSGNSCVASSAGSALATVGKAGSTTVLTTTPNPSLSGQTVTMTATVSAAAPGGGTPTGTVTFFDGLTPIGTAPVVGGVATLTKSNFSVGVHTLTASYSGSTCNNPSTSAAVLQQVVSNTPPSLLFATPGFGPRTGGSNVLLVGSNLASVTSVTFGGVAGTLVSVTGSMVTVTAPPHAPGNVNVVAHSPAGNSNAVNYTYV
ncbi:Ig-like domain repeat protein, partial [Streptomyces sp. ME03-5709C]|nr:Ig-like domain repeat protein [Streptomyces sp. ME03-5709C]